MLLLVDLILDRVPTSMIYCSLNAAHTSKFSAACSERNDDTSSDLGQIELTNTHSTLPSAQDSLQRESDTIIVQEVQTMKFKGRCSTSLHLPSAISCHKSKYLVVAPPFI